MVKPKVFIPSMSLCEALSITEIAVNLSGRDRKIPGEILADKLHQSPTSSSFIRKLYTLKNYGLLEPEIKREKTAGKTKIVIGDCKITDLAIKIIHSLNEKEKQEALIEAFLRIDIFREIYEKYRGTVLPAKDTLTSLLVRNYNISKKDAEKIYDLFIDSAKCAKLIREENGEERLISKEELLRSIEETKTEHLTQKDELKMESTHIENFEILQTKDFSFKVRLSPQAVTFARKMFNIWIEMLEQKLKTTSSQNKHQSD